MVVEWKQRSRRGALTERLSVIEHKAVIQPASEAIHHKPVFQSVHIIKMMNKITENQGRIAKTPINHYTEDFFGFILS